MTGVVYCITEANTLRQYIGSTTMDIETRVKGHLAGLRTGRHANCRLQLAYDMYGEDSFWYEVLEEVQAGPPWVREREWMRKADPKMLFNIKSGRWSDKNVRTAGSDTGEEKIE